MALKNKIASIYSNSTAFLKPVLFICLAALGNASFGQSENEQAIEINIVPQPLGQAITQLATQTGLLIGVDSSLIADKQADALKGRYTPAQAIVQLLSGSGLRAVETASGRYIVELAPAAPQSTNNPDRVRLPEITVTSLLDSNSPYNTSYTRSKATAATKTNTPVIEIPVSIQVVPRAVLDDQKSVTIKDALQNVSGVQATPTLGNDTGFNIRGFRNDSNYRNGLIANGGNANFPTAFDTANLQSIEVLKGPASILFGRIEPGGMVNITTKRPLAIPYYSLEQQSGSYDLYRTQWDATGPVTKDGSLLYRFNGSYLNSESFRDAIFRDRIMVSGSLTWRPTHATELTLEVEGIHQKGQVDFGIPVIGNRPAQIPISRTFGDRNDPVDTDAKVHVGTEFTHRFNSNWLVRNRFLMTDIDQNQTFFNPAPAFGAALRDNRFLDRNIFRQRHHLQSYATNLDLNGNFGLGSTFHEVLVGFDYLRSQTNYFMAGEFSTPAPALTVDIFNPMITATDTSIIRQTLQENNRYTALQDEWAGVYFQDRITLWNKLHILAGGRYDWVSAGRSFSPASFSEAEKNVLKRKDEAFNPRVGILYQLLTQVSLFSNWTTSFGANNGVSATGASFDPQIGEQFEAGIKTALFKERLITTLAFYYLTRENILTRDLSTPDPLDSIAVGKQRSKGIELDISGQVTEELSVIGSYAYTDAEIIRDNSGFQGHRLPQAPKHAGSAWLRYIVKKIHPLNGFSFGIGVFAVAEREGDIQNTFKLPGYARLDAFAAYSTKLGATRLTAQINARNILDERYYESNDPASNIGPRLGVYPGAPVTVLGSLRLEY